eukprot:GEMP01001445.1.p1 GENE.GEMP01001445.1~~GEMP01001445.1.p1  ORF type:complete len:1447 (+),score=275.80 GEMP01001445.1:28-4368(+)
MDSSEPSLQLWEEPAGSIAEKLYRLLYSVADADVENIEAQLHDLNPKVGICTAQWGARHIAFRCFDCETDDSCVICPPCYFESDHEGHRVQIIRTGNGCCDCGDEGSWKKEGFCPNHGQPVTREFGRSTLERLPPAIRENAETVIPAAVRHCNEILETLLTTYTDVSSSRAIAVLEWLSHIGSVFLGFRFAIIDALMVKADGKDNHTRAHNWVCVNHRLEVGQRECAASVRDLIVTLVQTSREFKLYIAWCYIHNYGEITHASTQSSVMSSGADMGSLAVQLFSIEDVAIALAAPGDPVGMCFFQIVTEITKTIAKSAMEVPQSDTAIKDIPPGASATVTMVLRIMLSHAHDMDYGLVFMIHDLGYILHSPHVSSALLFGNNEAVAPARKILCDMLRLIWKADVQTRVRTGHIGHENLDALDYFQVETMFSMALNNFTDLCRLPTRTFDELKEWYIYLRDALFIRATFQTEDVVSSRDEASFHILFLRFFVRCINWDVMMRDLDSGMEQRWLDMFPVAFLLRIMSEAVGPLAFTYQINAQAWVRNGENMLEQASLYEGRNGGFATIGPRVADIVCIQFAMILLTLHGENPTRHLLEATIKVNTNREVARTANAQAVNEFLESLDLDPEDLKKWQMEIPEDQQGQQCKIFEDQEQIWVILGMWWSTLVDICDPHMIELFQIRGHEPQRQEISLRRELISLLVAKRQTQKSLESLVSPELKKLLKEEQWSKVLNEIAESTYDQQKRFVSLKHSQLVHFDSTFSYAFMASKARELEPKAEETMQQQKNAKCGMLGPSLSNPSYYSTTGSSVARRILDELVKSAFPMKASSASPALFIIKKLKLIRLQETPTWGINFLQTLDVSNSALVARMSGFLKKSLLDESVGSPEDAINVKRAQLRDAAKSRQAAILEKMRLQQAKFSAVPGEDEEMELEDDSEEEITCCMCREGSSTGPLGYLCYAEPRPFFKPSQPKCVGWTSCGHVIHVSCGVTLCSQRRSENSTSFFDRSMKEFDCPVCRGLSNWILPMTVTAENLDSLKETYTFWGKLGMDETWSILDSLLVQLLVTMKWSPHIVEAPANSFFPTIIRTLVAHERAQGESSTPQDTEARLASVLAAQNVSDWSQANCMLAVVRTLTDGEVDEEEYNRITSFLVYTRSFQLLAQIVPDLHLESSGEEKTALEWYQSISDPPVPVADFEAFLKQGCWAIRALADVLHCCVWDIPAVERTKLAFAIQEGGFYFDLPGYLEGLRWRPCAPNKVFSLGDYCDSLNLTGAAPFPASIVDFRPSLSSRLFPEFPPLMAKYRDVLHYTYNRPCGSPSCQKVPIDPYLCLRCGEVFCVGIQCGASKDTEGEWRIGGCRAHSLECGMASIFLSVYNVHLVAISTRGFCGLWDDVPYLNSNGEITGLSRCLSLRADTHRLKELEQIYCTSIRREIFRHSIRTARFIPHPFEL